MREDREPEMLDGLEDLVHELRVLGKRWAVAGKDIAPQTLCDTACTRRHVLTDF